VTWLLVVAAGLFETAFAITLKLSDGFSKLLPTIAFMLLGGGSFALLSVALKTLPVGTAYAVWTGIGVAGTAIFGILFLGDARSAARLASIALILAGVVGLRLSGASAA